MPSTLTIPWGNADWNAILPLGVVALTPLLVIAADLLLPRPRRRGVVLALAALGLVFAGFLAARGWGHPYAAFGGGFVTGGFTIVFQEIVIAGALFSLLLATHLGRDDQAG